MLDYNAPTSRWAYWVSARRSADRLADAASFRYFTEGQFDPIAVVAGLIQTAIYADFGYIVSTGVS
jgi:hypothetical protein